LRGKRTHPLKPRPKTLPLKANPKRRKKPKSQRKDRLHLKKKKEKPANEKSRVLKMETLRISTLLETK